MLLLAADAFRVALLQGEMTLSFLGLIADRYGLTVQNLLSSVTDVPGQQSVPGGLRGDSEVFLNAAAREPGLGAVSCAAGGLTPRVAGLDAGGAAGPLEGEVGGAAPQRGGDGCRLGSGVPGLCSCADRSRCTRPGVPGGCTSESAHATGSG